MNQENFIKQKAHRKLRKFERYHSLKSEYSPTYVQEIALQEKEELIGVYENYPGEHHENIVITTLGLHVFLNQWVYIGYDQINRIESPEKKLSVKELVIHLNSGEVIKIPITGGGETTRDVWIFLDFLISVRSDVNERS